MRVTLQEKERRLELLETFRPGEVGKELDQAARMMVDDSDSDEMLVDAVQTTPQKWDKGEYGWIRNIARWGYPPGWTSALSKPFPLPPPITLSNLHHSSRADGKIYRPDRNPQRSDIFT